jgi:hypothetical protein
LAIGGCTIGELMERMTAKEASSWKQYENIIGSVGEQRSDYRAAMIAQTVATAFSSSDNPPTIDDFLPKIKIVTEQIESSNEADNIRSLVNKYNKK